MHENLDRAVEAVLNCYRSGGKLLLCGNGGSTADCAHIVGEFVKGFRRRRSLSEALKGYYSSPPKKGTHPEASSGSRKRH